jgi:hypothetical protein
MEGYRDVLCLVVLPLKHVYDKRAETLADIIYQ